MPIGRSAKKSLRKSNRQRAANLRLRKDIKKTIKEFLAKPTETALKKVSSILDKAVKKNIYHRNRVARLKSEYSKRVKVKRTAKEKMSK